MVDDPLRVLESIYGHLNLTWSDEVADRLDVFLPADPRHQRGKDPYDAIGFGMNNEWTSRFFGKYRSGWGAPTDSGKGAT
jgi:hypothetical protein